MGFALAFIFGFIACRLGLPPLVGYLVSGIVIGSYTPGFVADAHLAGQLAEIGVMLLMFGVGLHFSISDLAAVRRIAIPGAIGQIVIATAIGAAMAMSWGWTFGAGLVLGLSVSVASTVVLLKALEERNAVDTPNGRVAIGWLIVEDLAMVLALVLIPTFAVALGGSTGDDAHAGEHGLFATVAITLVKVGAFVALALVVGPRVMPWILRQAARTGSRELFTLATLALALGIAFGSAKLFGVSFALGAFFAGVVASESSLSHKAAASSLPLQDAFAVLFFVSVGMLFDPGVILREPWQVLAIAGLIMFGKSLVAFGIVLALGYPASTGLMVSAALAQIGEFSFILAGLGISYKLLPAEGLNLILAGALLSITLNPLCFAGAERLCGWLKRRNGGNAWGEKKFALLEGELAAAKERAAAKAAAHKTFTPEELVERFPLFAKLTPEQREVLIVHFEAREADPGERIIRKGDVADMMYFIAEGQVEATVGENSFPLAAGDFFGEMALITGEPRSADVTTVDYCRFATVSAPDFRQFLKRFPDIRTEIAALAAERGRMNRQE